MRQDFRAAPVRRMVVMGESNAYGMCATDPENEWVQVVASLIRRHEDGYLQVARSRARTTTRSTPHRAGGAFLPKGCSQVPSIRS